MFLESLSSFQGPFSWIKWKTELELLADFLYFGLTTISGREAFQIETLEIHSVGAYSIFFCWKEASGIDEVTEMF